MFIPQSIAQMQQAMETAGYICEASLATTVFLALRLDRPLFLEGEAGVGKTEVAKILAAILQRPLIRLQCYEGLDAHTALYEWNYSAQLLEIRLMEAAGQVDREAARSQLFRREHLLRRPLLQAIDHDGTPPVLLIDEIDRADEEFEAFLLEVLSDFQVTIPELGVIKAPSPPTVVITSNRTREIHDALKRRCLYHWIDYPSFDKELAIVLKKTPKIGEELAHQVVAFVQELRKADLFKAPGVAETLDWANALLTLGCCGLDQERVEQTLGVLLKYRDDVQRAQSQLIAQIIARVSRSSVQTSVQYSQGAIKP